MIQKKIHYCWFGGEQLPDKDRLCISSWKKYCPDYEIIEWNESNYNIRKNKYMYEAYKNKKWGFVPDYARFDIVYNNGGIYLDTDVEIIKPIDELLTNKAFMGLEEGCLVNGGIGFGAEIWNPIMKGLRDMYDMLSFLKDDGSINTLPSPYYITDYLLKHGLVRKNEIQDLDIIKIYPSEFFAPMEFSTGRLKITENTYSIHHYNASWLEKDEKDSLEMSRKINRIFGKKIGGKLNGIISRTRQILNKIFGK